jgi:O-antigen ligase
VPEISIVQAAFALLAAGCLVALVLWLGWRMPTGLFVLALAALAIRPQLLFDGSPIGVGWGVHQSLLLFALVINAAKHGLRKTVNWPVLALAAVLALNLSLGNLDPRTTPGLMIDALAVLALPWTFTQVVLAPGSRRICALAIALLPLISVAIGAVLTAAGLRLFFTHRLEGATGNAAVFALLAFTGFAVALHESTRRGRPFLGVLAAANLALVVLSGTRMAIFASGLFLAVYAMASPALREQWRKRWVEALVGAGLVVAAAIYYWPTLQWRSFGGPEGGLRLSGRDELWSFYYDQFLMSPIAGRGLGAGFVAAEYWIKVPLPTPHNEYLHLLVTGGVLGFVACAVAIVLWCRQLWQRVATHDRIYLIALLPAFAAYAVTDNVLIYSSGLALFAYLDVLLTRSASRHTCKAARRRRRKTLDDVMWAQPGSGRA